MYFYYKRLFKGNNVVSVLAYLDFDNDGYMNDTDKVIKFNWQGTTNEYNADLLNYIPVGVGDFMGGSNGSDMPGSVTLNRTKIEEVGREGLVDWRRTSPGISLTLRQLEYGNMQFWRTLANTTDDDTRIDWTDYKTPQVDIAAYETDDSGTFTGTVPASNVTAGTPTQNAERIKKQYASVLPNLIDSAETIAIFSHIGVALLLFIVGLNLSPKLLSAPKNHQMNTKKEKEVLSASNSKGKLLL